jgi:hypothetical protein
MQLDIWVRSCDKYIASIKDGYKVDLLKLIDNNDFLNLYDPEYNKTIENFPSFYDEVWNYKYKEHLYYLLKRLGLIDVEGLDEVDMTNKDR